MSALRGNLERLSARIASAARAAGRDPSEITLCAVTKGRGPSAVQEALDAGVKCFGENYVDEAEEKFPLKGADLRLIGHLQRNKADRARALCAAIDTVDSTALASRLGRSGPKLPVLIEVAFAPGRPGCGPEQVDALADAIESLPRLRLDGFFCVASLGGTDEARRDFATLRSLKERTEAQLGRQLPTLSMGMSQDFEAAIAEGSTMLRIGTALFGPR